MLPVQEGNERIRISMSLHVACRSEMDHRESYCAEDLNSFYRPPFSSCHLGGSRSLSAGNLVCKTATTFLSSFFKKIFLTVQEVRHVSQAVAEENKQQPTRSIGPKQNLLNRS
jgi:hypothetical protein